MLLIAAAPTNYLNELGRKGLVKPDAPLDEVRRFIEEELETGRHFSDIKAQLVLDGVPSSVIEEASTVELPQSPPIRLGPPVQWEEKSVSRVTWVFFVLALCVLSFFLAALLRILLD